MIVPSRTCACGCGERTGIARQSNTRYGWVRGVPVTFKKGHSGRKAVRYIEEDRGYDTPCWIWQLALVKGYGHEKIDGKPVLAHRTYYEKAKGRIPEGLQLDHLCRNRACVNPDHLEPVTAAENQHRRIDLKLDPEKVQAIKRLLASRVPMRKIASQFGISYSVVWSISAGRAWKDVPCPD